MPSLAVCPALAFILPCPAVQPALPLTSLCRDQMCPLQLLVDCSQLEACLHNPLHIALSSVMLACTLHPLSA